MELVLIRHALPVRHEPESGPADPELSPVGVEQSEALAAWSRTAGIDAICSSPMRRARETAAPLAAALGLPVTVDDDLVEHDKHLTSYVPYEELAPDDPRAIRLRDWALGLDPASDPVAFRSIVVGAMDRIVTAHPGRRVAVVCHGGVINTYVAHVLGLDQHLFFHPRYTGLSRVQASRTGVRSLFTLNEAPHLQDPDRPAPVTTTAVPG